MKAIVKQNAQTDRPPVPFSAPLVVYNKSLENMPLDRNAGVTLTRLAHLVDELRRSGLSATLNVTGLLNEVSKSGRGFKTEGVDARIEIEGNGSFKCRGAFRDDRDEAFFWGMGTVMGGGVGGVCGMMMAGTAVPFSALGAGVGLLAPAAIFLSYKAIKTGSLKAAFQEASDLLSNRISFQEAKTEILREIAQTLVNQAGDEKCITLTPREMTPSLKEIVRYAGTQGVRVDLVLPGSGKALSATKSPAPTLGEIAAQIVPTPSTPAPPKPDAEQEKWAGGLAASFNRLSEAVNSLDSNVKAAAQPLLEAVQRVQTLCAEVQINNARIGKVAQELDNVSDQIDAYARLNRLGIWTPEDGEGLAGVFSIKAASIAARFVWDLEAIRGNFQDRQRLLEKDYI